MVAVSGATNMLRYFHADRQGSVIAMADASGTLVEGPYTYDPYGHSADSGAGVPFRYTGRRLDAETGLYYYRARYYSASLGRFLQADPIGYVDQLNLYAYVKNNPVGASDPSGRQAVPQPKPEAAPSEPTVSPPTPANDNNPEPGDWSAFWRNPISRGGIIGLALTLTGDEDRSRGAPVNNLPFAELESVLTQPDRDDPREFWYHYTTVENALSIGQQGKIRTWDSPWVYVTDSAMPATRAANNLFAGFRDTSHASGVVVFSAPVEWRSQLSADPSIPEYGYRHWGSIYNGANGVRFLYAGPNRF